LAEAIIFNPGYPNLLMDNDAAGIHQLNADSSALFENVFKTHFKSLHAYALAILKDDATAEEIVQNVFYKLWEKKDKITIESSLTAYLYKAVYYESLNYLKHVKVKEIHHAHVTRHNVGGDTTDSLALKELQQKIDLAITQLPEQCRTIFQLSRYEGLKYRMIADKMGISVKTVESQMGKALKTLRIKLIEYLPLLLLIINLKNVIR
jgi:RNA polymerase sigma-70 factor (ECF subfamily)